MTTTPVVWVFEGRNSDQPSNPLDSRELNIFVRWRFAICIAIFLIMFGFAGFARFLTYAWPFLLAKAIPYFFHYPTYRDFLKSSRRLLYGVFFIIFGGIILEFFRAIVGIDIMRLDNMGMLFPGVLHFLFAGAWEVIDDVVLKLVDQDRAAVA